MLSLDTRSPAPRSSFFFLLTVAGLVAGRLAAGDFVAGVFVTGDFVAGDFVAGGMLTIVRTSSTVFNRASFP